MSEAFSSSRPFLRSAKGWQPQAAKLSTDKARWTVTIIVTVAADGSQREQLCIPVRKLPAFLATISPRKVKPELRDKIILYQNECDEALWQYWTQGRAERISSDQSTAPALPSSADAPLTPDQQCTLQAIAKQIVASLPEEVSKTLKGGAFPKLWSKFNNHFRLAKYSQLPQSRMTEAIEYLMQIDLSEDQKPALPTAKDQRAALPAVRKALPSIEDIKRTNREYWNALTVFRQSIATINARCDAQLTALCRAASETVFPNDATGASDSLIDIMIEAFQSLKYRQTEDIGKTFDKVYKDMLVLRAMAEISN